MRTALTKIQIKKYTHPVQNQSPLSFDFLQKKWSFFRGPLLSYLSTWFLQVITEFFFFSFLISHPRQVSPYFFTCVRQHMRQMVATDPFCVLAMYQVNCNCMIVFKDCLLQKKFTHSCSYNSLGTWKYQKMGTKNHIWLW